MSVPSYITDSGSGTPVILLHAFPVNGDLWQEQHNKVPFRILSFDLPGFGRETKLPATNSMSAYCDTLFELMDAFSIDHAVLGGCSMGGYIAMEAMRRDESRFKGLILSNTRAGADSEEARTNRLNQANDIVANGSADLVATMREKLIGGTSKTQQPALQDKLTQMMQAASLEGIASALRAMAARPDSLETLRGLSIPVCIIAGGEDQLIPASEAQIMHDAIPGSELHIVETSGHMTCLEQPETFNGIITAFVEKLG